MSHTKYQIKIPNLSFTKPINTAPPKHQFNQLYSFSHSYISPKKRKIENSATMNTQVLFMGSHSHRNGCWDALSKCSRATDRPISGNDRSFYDGKPRGHGAILPVLRYKSEKPLVYLIPSVPLRLKTSLVRPESKESDRY